MGGTEIAFEIFFGIAAFLVTQDHTFPVAKHREASGHGCIIADVAVSVEFGEIGKCQ